MKHVQIEGKRSSSI